MIPTSFNYGRGARRRGSTFFAISGTLAAHRRHGYLRSISHDVAKRTVVPVPPVRDRIANLIATKIGIVCPT